MARKVKMPVSTKAEIAAMVKAYFETGRGVIKVYPTRYAYGHYRSTLTNVIKQK